MYHDPSPIRKAAAAFIVLPAMVAGVAAQRVYTFSLRSGEIVRTLGWSAADVLWRTMIRTRLSSRYFGGRPDSPAPGAVLQ